MSDEIPWRNHLIRGVGLLIVILAFQQLARGEITPSVALIASGGYVLVAELIRRWVK